MFKRIKKFYDRNLWTIDQVHFAVGVVISEEEFKEITGEEYVA